MNKGTELSGGNNQPPAAGGILYLVATPIGNLEDITYRAVRILNEVDLIAAEDTRHTLKLLNYFQIKKKMISYYQHNERERTAWIVPQLLEGASVALVTDAGMPGISDPGNILVAEAVHRGVPVVPIPGPSALILALAASGFDTTSFRFEGFLPRKAREREAVLRELANYSGTLVFYEAPHRLETTLGALLAVFGERRAVLARELTKIHEEFLRGGLSEILRIVSERAHAKNLRGEFCVVIEGRQEGSEIRQNSTQISLATEQNLQASSNSLREELRAVAARTGKSTKEVYRMYLEEKKQKNKD